MPATAAAVHVHVTFVVLVLVLEVGGGFSALLGCAARVSGGYSIYRPCNSVVGCYDPHCSAQPGPAETQAGAEACIESGAGEAPGQREGLALQRQRAAPPCAANMYA